MSEYQSPEEWQRLYELYHAMSDGELLELAAAPEDLTSIARELVSQETKRRRLSVPCFRGETADLPEAEGVGSGRISKAKISPQSWDLVPEGPEVELNTFFDALDARRACEHLEAVGIPFHVRDVSTPMEGLRNFLDGPPVALRVTVRLSERLRAQEILRTEMGLFPLQEVDVADAPVDDGTIAVVGEFGEREQAEELAKILADADYWSRVTTHLGGTKEDENRYTLEVREVDLFAAAEVVEDALELD